MLNKIITSLLPLMPKSIVYIFAKKYIAGDDIKSAIKLSKDLKRIGGMTTIDALGEFVNDKKMALFEKERNLEVLKSIEKNNLDSYLSLKPTSVGLSLDYDFAHDNIKELLDFAKSRGLFIRLDMENSPYTTDTLKLYKQFRDEGYDNIGFVIQAYLKRSFEDIKSLKDYKPNTRLCKGIYNEDPSIAYKDREEIKDNYKMLLKYMFENDYYIGIATHDKDLLDFSKEYISTNQISNDRYEFQMLLGVTELTRANLIREGYKMRVYIPFGKDWYGYSLRRLNENPQMAGHIFKSIFIKR